MSRETQATVVQHDVKSCKRVCLLSFTHGAQWCVCNRLEPYHTQQNAASTEADCVKLFNLGVACHPCCSATVLQPDFVSRLLLLLHMCWLLC